MAIAPLILVPVNLVLIILYLIARNKQDLKRTAIIQPLTTLVSLGIAALSFLSPRVNPGYTTAILIGMGLCLAADIFNIDMNNPKIFLAGIVAFIFAYLEYAVTYTIFNKGFQAADILVGVIFTGIYIFLMRLYWKNLGSFKIPVMIYGLIMPFMVTRAISTLFGGEFSLPAALLVTIGSSMLFLGDVEYGVHRFVRPGKFTVGPICYAGGQLLIALSCATFFA
jgi:uncharacterized membrane protein YhhN